MPDAPEVTLLKFKTKGAGGGGWGVRVGGELIKSEI